MIKEAHRIIRILKKSFKLVTGSNPILLSAATAFFTMFALAPILIILSRLLNLFFDRKSILPKLFAKIATAFGEKAAADVGRIVNNFLSLETGIWVSAGLMIFFYFVATTWLSAVRQAIHQVWEIKKKTTRKINYHVKERLIEIAMILLIGVLFLITLQIDRGLTAFRNFLEPHSAVAAASLFFTMDTLLSILIISAWFTALFRFMPEALVEWKVALAGGVVTGFLFVFGKLTLTKLLVHGTIEELFGPSSSVAVILLFIFYCSFILYFGTSFTFEYANAMHVPIHPGKLGEKYMEKVVETGKTVRGKR